MSAEDIDASASEEEYDDEEGGEMLPCKVCGRQFFVTKAEIEMGEPKICSQKCADEMGGVAA
jgi:hypothetical protein